MPRILAIIQARLLSTRLPEKTLEYFSGETLLGHIINRLRFSKYIEQIVVATGEKAQNKKILDYCKNSGITCYPGNEDDVLARFYHVMQKYNTQYIVRVTADDPLKDPQIIDRAIEHIFADNSLDYVSNTLVPTYPEGLDIEVFKSSALELAYNRAKLPSEREHVTPFIWKNDGLFKVLNFMNDEDLSHLRWTVDYPEDLDFIKMIYKQFETVPIFYMHDVIEFLKNKSLLGRTSADVLRNEGYLKGVQFENT